MKGLTNGNVVKVKDTDLYKAGEMIRKLMGDAYRNERKTMFNASLYMGQWQNLSGSAHVIQNGDSSELYNTRK